MPKEIIEVPAYDPGKGAQAEWVDGFELQVSVSGNGAHIVGNKEGLTSLAKHLLFLAQEAVPKGCHFHYDEHGALAEGSAELIIEKQ